MHYLYGGSTWSRTQKCPAWAVFCMLNGLESSAGAAAQRGTELHEQVEKLLRHEIKVKNADALAVAAHKQFLDSVDMISASIFIEHEMSVGDFVGGTADAIVYYESCNKLAVVDFKFGALHVDVCNNAQLYFYAALYAQATRYNISTLEFIIIQPTLHNTAQTWTADIDELQNTISSIRELREKVAQGKQLNFEAGDHCKYCPAMGKCPKTSFDFSKLTDSTAVETQLATYEKLELVKKIIGKYENELMRKLTSGEQVSGFALCDTRAMRCYSDEELVETILIDNKMEDIAYDKKLKTPAQLEKVLGKKTFDELLSVAIVKKSSGKKLAAGEVIEKTENKIINEDIKIELKKIFGENK